MTFLSAKHAAWFKAGVTISLIALALYLFDIEELGREIAVLDAAFFSIIALLVLANMGVIYIRLLGLFRLFRYNLPPKIVYRAHVAGLVSGLFIFNIAGTIIGRNLELRHAGVSASAVAVLSTLEKGIAFVISLGLLIGGFVTLFGFEGFNANSVLGNAWLFGITLTSAFALAGWVMLNSGGTSGLLRQGKNSDLPRTVQVIALSMISQGIMLAVYSGAILYLHPELNPVHVVGAAAIVSFSASMPISINGWGVRELASVFAFGVLGVSAPEALAVSIAVGAVSTLLVVASGLTLFAVDGQKSPTTRPVNQPDAGVERPAIGSADAYLRFAAFFLPFICAVALFFQLQLDLFGSAITVNLADTTAVIALALVPSLLLTRTRIPIHLSPSVLVWFALASSVIVLSFLLGVWRFGVTPWALNNRLTGWLVILGYVCVGAMFVGAWGNRATRRFAEFLACAAVAAVLANLFVFVSHRFFDSLLVVETNFQGFSGNRNTFAFQLLVTLILLVGTSRARLSRSPAPLLVAIAVILLGILLSESKAAILCLAFLAVFTVLTKGLRNLPLRVIVPVIAISMTVVFFAATYNIETNSFAIDDALRRYLGTVNFESLSQRWVSISEGVFLWLDYPVFGAGLGFFIQDQTVRTGQALVIHSTPIWVLSEMGLIGTIVLIGLPLLWAARRLFGAQRRQDRLLVLLIIALLIFGMVHEIYYQRIFWVCAGMCLGAFAFRQRHSFQQLPDRIKTLHVITSFNRGGAETMLLGLLRLNQTTENHRQTHIVTSLLSNSALTEEARATGTKVHELGFTPSQPSLRGLLFLAWLIRREKPDIVQGWMYHGDLVALIALYLSGRRDKTRLVWGVRCSDMDLSKYSLALRVVVWCCARTSRLTDAITANSTTGREVHLRLGYDATRFDVIPNGTDTERFCPEPARRDAVRSTLGLPQDKRIFAHVARVDPMKDHAGLLKVAASLPEAHFVLVGKGTEALNLPDNVTALGQRGDVNTVLTAADAIVSSSAYGEGFSNAIVEGMSAGLVPVGTDVGDTREIIADTGWVVPPSDGDALKDALKRIVELDADALAEHQRSARKRVVDHFTLEVASQAFRDVYERTSIPPTAIATRPEYPAAQDRPAAS